MLLIVQMPTCLLTPKLCILENCIVYGRFSKAVPILNKKDLGASMVSYVRSD